MEIEVVAPRILPEHSRARSLQLEYWQETILMLIMRGMLGWLVQEVLVVAMVQTVLREGQ